MKISNTSEVKVLEFQLSYVKLDKKLSKYPKTYLCCKALCWSDVLVKHNARVNRWLRPTSKGTKVNCVPLESEEQMKKEMKKINECMKEGLDISTEELKHNIIDNFLEEIGEE